MTLPSPDDNSKKSTSVYTGAKWKLKAERKPFNSAPLCDFTVVSSGLPDETGLSHILCPSGFCLCFSADEFHAASIQINFHVGPWNSNVLQSFIFFSSFSFLSITFSLLIQKQQRGVKGFYSLCRHSSLASPPKTSLVPYINHAPSWK